MPKVSKKKYKHLFDEFHPTLNKQLKLNKLDVKSRKFIYWKCTNKYCKKDWKDTVWGRTLLGRGCPNCKVNLQKRKINDRFYIQKDLDEFKKICDKIDVFLKDFTGDRKIKRKGVMAKVSFFKLKKIEKKIREKISKQKKYNIKKSNN